jgi:hypothetical protein
LNVAPAEGQSSISPAKESEPLPDWEVERLIDIHRRHYSATSQDEFLRLWQELTQLCEVGPGVLELDTVIEELCPNSPNPLITNSRLENIEGLIAIESRNYPPPKRRMRTVRDVMDYLLQVTRSDRSAR